MTGDGGPFSGSGRLGESVDYGVVGLLMWSMVDNLLYPILIGEEICIGPTESE